MFFTHPACIEHDTGPGHPESANRLRAVLEALEDPLLADIPWRLAPRASNEHLLRVHSLELLERIQTSAPHSGIAHLDADTVMGDQSLEAAYRAAGATIAAVDAVLDGAAQRAFCATRPPGHHATRERAMGFCLFNNISVAAAQALARGLQRIAIVDFDVHHGNGTQDIFESEPRVLYASSHQWPLYPGSGDASEVGVGNIHNVALLGGTRSMEFRHAWAWELLPAISAFAPELILISAGFDGHRLDPLAQLNLSAEDFFWLTSELVRIASQTAGGRVVSTLEGGYSLQALHECTLAHCCALFDIRRS